MCHRRFKNIPALNGHMRLHGGYFKKVSDLEKDESKKDKEEGNSESQPPELTPQPPASSSGADSNSSNASLTEARNMSLAQHLQQPIQQQQQQQQQHQPIQQQQQHQQLQQPMGPPKLEPAISVKLESSLAVSSNQGQPTNFVSTSHMTAGQLSVKKVNVMPPPSSVHLPLSGGFSMSQSQSLNSDEGLLSSFAGVAVGRELGMEQTGVGVKPSSANTRIPSAFTFTDADSVKTKQKLLQALQEPSFRPIQQENLLRPMQEVNERKRHASADPDKFTSPTRKNSLTSPGSLAYMLTNFQKTGSTVKCELEKRRSQEFFDQDEMFVRPEPVRSRSRPDEHSIGRPRSRTDDPFHARKGIEEGMGVFRNPGAMHGSQIKAKRKHRPEPLVIPQNMSHFGFQSRLRSPRIWEPSGAEKKTGHTPPPYTPPPMLSPVRSGSGLFWSIQPHPLRPVTPKSAPVTPKIRRGSFGLSHSVGGVTSWSGLIQTKEPIKEEEDEEEEEEEEEEGTEVEEETQIEPPPETDIQPHVNIGPQYQADVPSCLESRNRIYFDDRVREDLVWDPAIIDHTTEDEVQSYQEFASCAAVPGNGVNMEYALHLLHIVKGDVQKAILELMKATPKLPNRHPLVTFSYQESDTWSSEEIEAFIEGMLKFDKDFFNVSKEVKTKTTKQCIQFYYLWKKVCLDEYKRMRILRRKRTDDDIYNLRSRAAQQDDLEHQQQTQADSDDSDDDSSATGNVEEPNEKEPDASNGVQIVYTCAYPNCNASFPSKQALSGHIRIHVNSSEGNTRKSAEPSPHRSPHRKEGTGPPSNKSTVSEGVEEFPCKICGKVFYKVKSRSAHMKSHSDKERNRKNALAAQNNSPYSPYSDT
ncbi:ELM2 and SANT domain-containing protein 1 [Lingula anatina]|uniref:ELM2 and SANT domain-containing protein 1 n=1 Tax=Lingula anatina TaxID=7574 RepID=A0A1S3HSX5_LINAN|nr:ELM2 and SANT domain-containing protein 1 [Lingula anatina]|eukprot:XP_013389123.1 ELM2 and SANT domain-containing protein 1 [Lingula anatina]